MLTSLAKVDQILVVFGAEGGQADRLRALPGYIVRQTADPTALSRLLAAASDRATTAGHGSAIAGLVFDLTDPRRGHRLRAPADDTQGAGRGYARRRMDADVGDRAPQRQEETGVALFCGGLLAAVPHLSHLPVGVVSCDGTLAVALHAYGASAVAHLHPDEDDAAWRFALEEILGAAEGPSGRPALGMSSPPTPDTQGCRPTTAPRAAGAGAPREVLYLHAQAWADLARCLIWVGDHAVALTGREVRVLDILARAPGRFHTASAIARQLAPMSFDIDAHCVEQTISGLRRKLGETARAPRAFVSRRGLGYALIAEGGVPQAAPSRATPPAGHPIPDERGRGEWPSRGRSAPYMPSGGPPLAAEHALARRVLFRHARGRGSVHRRGHGEA